MKFFQILFYMKPTHLYLFFQTPVVCYLEIGLPREKKHNIEVLIKPLHITKCFSMLAKYLSFPQNKLKSVRWLLIR